MLQEIKKYWHVFWVLRKIHLMRMMDHRGDFYFWTGISVMWTIFNFFFMTVIVQAGGSIGGWNLDEIILLMAVFTMVDAFTWSFFFHNMRLYTLAVFSGELNAHLLKPIDTQYFIMIFDNSYTNVFRFLIGVAMLIRSIKVMSLDVTIASVVAFICLYLLTSAFVYFLWFTLSTLSFWVERLENINEIIPSLRRLWQVPSTIYTGVFSWVFTVVLPLGLITSLPSEALLHRLDSAVVIRFTIITIITMLFSRWFFHFSIKRYTGMAN